jgi:hypothetical protein
MNKNHIDNYLRSLERELHLRGLSHNEILAEVESHLLDARDQGIQKGLDPQSAQQQALDRFGSARLLARRFESERNSMKQKLLLIAAVVFGLVITFIDTRASWDDTGITVMALLFVSGAVGLLAEKRPWLFALAVGLWLPLWYILTTHDLKMLIVLAFPFVGVYTGWALRSGIRKLRRAG